VQPPDYALLSQAEASLKKIDPGLAKVDLTGWKKSPEAQKLAEELLTLEPIRLAAGVEVIALTTSLMDDSNDDPMLIQTEKSRTMWDNLKATMTAGRTYKGLVVGNPGIGKSRGLLYLLKLLLADRCVVLFQYAKLSELYLFIPSTAVDDGYITLTRNDELVAVQSSLAPLLKCNNNNKVWHVIDPGEDKPYLKSTCKTVLASSPNHDRYNEWMKNNETMAMQEPWEWKEILAAAPFTREFRPRDEKSNKIIDRPPDESSTLSSEQHDKLKRRFKVFGGVPRHVYGDDSHIGVALGALFSAAGDMKYDVAKGAMNGTVEMLDHERKYTSYIFGAYRERGASVDTWSSDLRPISDFAQDLALVKYHETLSTDVPNVPEIAKGELFERMYAWQLQHGGKFRTTGPLGPDKTKSATLTLGKASIAPKPANHSDALKQWAELPTAVTQQGQETRQLVIAPPNFPCVDAFDARDRAYQITVNKKHTLNAPKWKKCLDKVNATEKHPLTLYICMPAGIATGITKRLPLSHMKDTKHKRNEERDLRKRYKEYLLVMPPAIKKETVLAYLNGEMGDIDATGSATEAKTI